MKHTNENHELWIFQRRSRIEIRPRAATTKQPTINELKQNESITYFWAQIVYLILLISAGHTPSTKLYFSTMRSSNHNPILTDERFQIIEHYRSSTNAKSLVITMNNSGNKRIILWAAKMFYNTDTGGSSNLSLADRTDDNDSEFSILEENEW